MISFTEDMVETASDEPNPLVSNQFETAIYVQTTTLALRQTNPKEEKLLVKMKKRKKKGDKMVKTMKEMMIELKKKKKLKKML